MVCLYCIGEAGGGGEWTLGAPRECVSLHNGVGTGDPLTNIFLSCWFETEFCFLSLLVLLVWYGGLYWVVYV